MASKNFDKVTEDILKTIGLKPHDDKEQELIERTLQLIGRLVRVDSGRLKIMGSKDLLMKLLIYYTKPQTNKSALITIHTLMVQVPSFRTILFDTHNFNLASFDAFVTTALANFKEAHDNNKWDDFQNICSSISGFVDCF